MPTPTADTTAPSERPISSMPTPDEIADCLDAAADRIEASGWTTGQVVNRDEHVCAMGAIEGWRWCDQLANRLPYRHRATREYVVITEAANALRRWIVRAYPTKFPPGAVSGSITWWNDSQVEDEYEVIDGLRRCAKEIRDAARDSH